MSGMMDAMPEVPSDAALAAAQEMLPALVALGDLFRCITDGDTHAKMIGQLREASANARAEAAKVAEAHAELEAARVAHAELIARERREHQERMVAEDKRRGAEHKTRQKSAEGARAVDGRTGHTA